MLNSFHKNPEDIASDQSVEINIPFENKELLCKYILIANPDWVIISPELVELIEDQCDFVKIINTKTSSVNHIGNLKHINIYVDKFVEKKTVLFGFKGKPASNDCFFV